MQIDTVFRFAIIQASRDTALCQQQNSGDNVLVCHWYALVKATLTTSLVVYVLHKNKDVSFLA